MSRPVRQTRLPGMSWDEPPAENATSDHVSQPLAKLQPADQPTAPSVAAESAAPAEEQPPRGPIEVNAPASLAGQTVYVVDSHSLIFQVFHALPEMTSPKGEPVGAVFGFARDIVYLLEEKQPDYLFCAFDLSGPTFRHEMFGDYKAHREEMPADLAPQIESIRRVLEALAVPVLECEGYEADDVMAAIARRVEALGGQCVLVTGDKDCRQLITDRVRLYNVRKDQFYDAAALAQDWGIRPGQVVDFQALVGDSVDNVPGIAGIGPKRAGELLQKYGTLENLLEHVEEISATKLRQNLIAGRQQALLSRKLARLDADAPVLIDWSAGRVGQYDPAKAAEVFASLGFRTLTEKMRRQAGTGLAACESPTDYQTVASPADLEALLERLRAQAQIGLHVVADRGPARWAATLGVAVAWGEGQGAYVPLGHAVVAEEPADENFAPLEALRPVLEDPAIAKVGHDLKRDMVALRAAGIRLQGATFDTMLAGYLLEAGERNHSLAELAQRHLDLHGVRRIDLEGSGKAAKSLAELPAEAVTTYAVQSADWPLRLQPVLTRRLDEWDLTSLFCDVEMPLVEVLADMESVGIKVDPQRLRQLGEQYGQRLAELEQEIYALAGHRFNIGSPKQLAEVLFVEQKLPVVKKTKTGASTDVDVLEALASVHPLPARIIEFRQYAKLKSTYIDALPALVHPRTGRVHATFHQAVAATGRLSSSDPNLQNIPIRTPEGREIRSAFLPGEPGWRLLAADYSQIELRVLAHFSADAALRAAFERDEDIHARVASQVYGVPLGEVNTQQRRVAKAVNFGIIYGQSPFGLAKALGIEQTQAAEFINAYFAGYPGVEAFLIEVLESCRRQGFVKTILGRRRAISGVRDPKLQRNAPPAARQLALPERTAINTVIQGSAADIIKLAMLRISRRLKAQQRLTRLLLQIHDELVFEAPPEELQEVKQMVVEQMSGVLPLAVPLKVDVLTGQTWAEC
jgi:DNA polymerase-1